MKAQFVPYDDAASIYQRTNVGKCIDADGDEFEGLPGLVSHDCPWACIAVVVEGGYMAFESESDYQAWKNQK